MNLSVLINCQNPETRPKSRAVFTLCFYFVGHLKFLPSLSFIQEKTLVWDPRLGTWLLVTDYLSELSCFENYVFHCLVPMLQLYFLLWVHQYLKLLTSTLTILCHQQVELYWAKPLISHFYIYHPQFVHIVRIGLWTIEANNGMSSVFQSKSEADDNNEVMRYEI